MVAHYQLQHKNTLAEIQLWGGGGAIEGVSMHVFAGWNQGKRHIKRVLSRIKGFVFGEQGNYTRAHKDKNINGATGQQDVVLGGILEAYIRHVLVM